MGYRQRREKTPSECKPFKKDKWAPVSIFARFWMAALFGGGVSLLLFGLLFQVAISDALFRQGLLLLPLVWGGLGIFFIDEMLHIGRVVMETIAKSVGHRY